MLSPVHAQMSPAIFTDDFPVSCVVLVNDMCIVGVVWQGSELGSRHGEGGLEA